MAGETLALEAACTLLPEIAESVSAASAHLMKEILPGLTRQPAGTLVDAIGGSATKTALETGLDSSLVAKLRPAIVTVDNQRKFGTGFVIDHGLVATADHVIGDSKTGQLFDDLKIMLADGSKQNAKVVLRAPNEDLALLHIPHLGSSLPRLPLGSSAALAPGSSIFTMAESFSLGQKPLRQGIFETNFFGINPNSGANYYATWMKNKLSSAVPGESGSPLVDKFGTVYGLLARSTGQSAEGAIAEHLNFAKKELAGGLPERGWIKFAAAAKLNASGQGGVLDKLFSELIS